MPELPEVETIRMGLEQSLVGCCIQMVEVRVAKLFHGEVNHIIGATITGVRRFGKGLVIDLDNEYVIAVHIKLTGQLIFSRSSGGKVKIIKNSYGTLPHKWTHVIISLVHKKTIEKQYLYYNDFRKFGWIKIVPSGELKKLVFFKELGPEFPLKMTTDYSLQITDKQFMTLEMFEKLLATTKMSIKSLLLEQKKISGIGNIYANDGLYFAKINPTRPADTLSKEEIKRLFESLGEVLSRGLHYGGASELSFVNAFGGEGNYQKHFLAYGQEGKPCKTCGESIKKIMVGGRGTYFCPKCQQ